MNPTPGEAINMLKQLPQFRWFWYKFVVPCGDVLYEKKFQKLSSSFSSLEEYLQYIKEINYEPLLNYHNNSLAVCAMGRDIRIVWLGFDNNSHRFRLTNLGGTAGGVLCSEISVELGSWRHYHGFCSMGDSCFLRSWGWAS